MIATAASAPGHVRAQRGVTKHRARPLPPDDGSAPRDTADEPGAVLGVSGSFAR
jgi:hypothetical protein